eukprot:scaffold11428_cov105-Isochrysis_galbana.AAC.5
MQPRIPNGSSSPTSSDSHVTEYDSHVQQLAYVCKEALPQTSWAGGTPGEYGGGGGDPLAAHAEHARCRLAIHHMRALVAQADELDGWSKLRPDERAARRVPAPADRRADVPAEVAAVARPVRGAVCWAGAHARARHPAEARVPIAPGVGDLVREGCWAGHARARRLGPEKERAGARQDAVAVAAVVGILDCLLDPEEGAAVGVHPVLEPDAAVVVPLGHQLHVVWHHLFNLASQVGGTRSKRPLAALLPATASCGIASAAREPIAPAGAVASLRHPVWGGAGGVVRND